MAKPALYRFKSLACFDIPITWWELFRRTAKDSVADDALGLAAQLAYYFFLSLFPTLLALVALASFFPLYNLTDSLVRISAGIEDINDLIDDLTQALAD